MNKKLTTIIFAIIIAFLAIIISLQYVYQKGTNIGDVQFETSPLSITSDYTRMADTFFKNLTLYKWIWVKTYNGTGPDAELDKSLYPRKIGAFTIIFHDDGTINGTTDCNNFSGTYTDIGEIQISVSTDKVCKGSQESEFLKMIKGGNIGLGENWLDIETDHTLIFNRGEKIK